MRSSQPTIVEVGYKINCVSNVSALDSTYDIDINVHLYWRDPKAIGIPNKSVLDLQQMKLFDPELVISNQHILTEIAHKSKVVDSSTGEIKCSLQYRGSAFIMGLDLALFPFDYQNLNFVLRPRRLASDKLILKVRKKSECAFNRSIVHDWEVMGHFTRRYFTDPRISSGQKEYSTLFITILGRRHPGWYINNVFIISACLLFYSWATYLVDAMDTRNKLEIMNCCVVAIIANKFVITDELPKAEYRTMVDVYIDSTFMLLMITLAAMFVVKSVYTEHGEESGKNVNLGLFLLNVVLFISLNVWLYFKVKSAKTMLADWHEKTQAADPNEVFDENMDFDGEEQLSTESDLEDILEQHVFMRMLFGCFQCIEVVAGWCNCLQSNADLKEEEENDEEEEGFFGESKVKSASELGARKKAFSYAFDVQETEFEPDSDRSLASPTNGLRLESVYADAASPRHSLPDTDTSSGRDADKSIQRDSLCGAAEQSPQSQSPQSLGASVGSSPATPPQKDDEIDGTKVRPSKTGGLPIFHNTSDDTGDSEPAKAQQTPTHPSGSGTHAALRRSSSSRRSFKRQESFKRDSLSARSIARINTLLNQHSHTSDKHRHHHPVNLNTEAAELEEYMRHRHSLKKQQDLLHDRSNSDDHSQDPYGDQPPEGFNGQHSYDTHDLAVGDGAAGDDSAGGSAGSGAGGSAAGGAAGGAAAGSSMFRSSVHEGEGRTSRRREGEEKIADSKAAEEALEKRPSMSSSNSSSNAEDPPGGDLMRSRSSSSQIAFGVAPVDEDPGSEDAEEAFGAKGSNDASSAK